MPGLVFADLHDLPADTSAFRLLPNRDHGLPGSGRGYELTALIGDRELAMVAWIGSFTIKELLDNTLNPEFPRPPVDKGVYLVTRKRWHTKPTQTSIPLYVGSNTSYSKLFRTRIGSLIADMFGFYGGDKGHHSGGQSLHAWCINEHVDPRDLFIAWTADTDCHRCDEVRLFDELSPLLNKKKPARCPLHQA
jgi:hypothetical protein